MAAVILPRFDGELGRSWDIQGQWTTALPLGFASGPLLSKKVKKKKKVGLSSSLVWGEWTEKKNKEQDSDGKKAQNC